MKRRPRVCVATVQTPFVRGGAEVLAESLIHELGKRGIETDLVSLPLVSYPKRDMLQGALTYRLLDLQNPAIPDVDLVIPLKFPAYALRHPRKIPWLLHQFRDVYDIFDSSYYHFTHSREDVEIREAIVDIDNLTLRECQQIYTISGNVTHRLLHYNGISSAVLYPPPRDPARYCAGEFGNYVLSVGRLEAIKRVDLLLRALALAPSDLRAVVVGTGSQQDALARLVEDLGLRHRVDLVGSVDTPRLVELYAKSRGVYYAPYDEDYGYVTVEAFLSGKPVITCADSGGTLEFVENDVNGWIVDPTPEGVSSALEVLWRLVGRLPELGQAGRARVEELTWDRVVDTFLEHID